MHFSEINHPVQPDTYEASMALSQLLRIGQHAIKLHNLLKDEQEMESWVAKKIDLAGDYVKKVYNYTQGEKAGFYESKEEIGDYAKEKKTGKMVRIVDFEDGIYTISYGEDKGENNVEAKDLEFMDQTGADQEEISKFDEDAGEGHMSKSTLYHTAKYAIELMQMIKKGDDLEGWVQSKINKAADYLQGAYNYEEYQKLSPYREDIDTTTFMKHKEIIKKNIDEILARETKLDDVDTKPGMMRILGKRVNEVEKKMAKEYKDDNKPRQLKDPSKEVMMQKDGKVVVVDKDREKDYRAKGYELAETEQCPPGQYYCPMSKKCKDIPDDVLDKDFDKQPRYKGQRLDVGEDQYNFRGNPFPVLGKAESYLNYGSDMAKAIINKDDKMTAMAQTYLDRVPSFIDTEMKEIFPKNEGDGRKAGMHPKGHPMRQQQQAAIHANEAELDEGLKDWARNLAAAGIIVGTLAGVGSINNALDNSVPAVKAMNTALELAQDAGNEPLAKMIKNDISATKIRLSSGKDLNFVKSMQNKYSKFMQTEGLAYESKLTVMLNQQLK